MGLLHDLFKYCVVRYTLEHRTIGTVVAVFDTQERAEQYQHYITTMKKSDEIYTVVPTSPHL